MIPAMFVLVFFNVVPLLFARISFSPTKSRTNDTLVSTTVSIVLHKVGFAIQWSRLVNQYSYKKQDLRYTGLGQCIVSPTKSTTYDTLVLTTVSIVLHKVGLTTHRSRLVYRQFYKQQVLRYTGLDHRIDSSTVEQDQRFVGLKIAKTGQQNYRHDM